MWKQRLGLLPLNIHCNKTKYHVLNINNWICITTLTQSLSSLFSCIPTATRLHYQPIIWSSSKLCQMLALTPSANSQPADRQLECSLPNLPLISGANIAASWHHCKHLPTPGSYSAASPQQHWHSLTVECVSPMHPGVLHLRATINCSHNEYLLFTCVTWVYVCTAIPSSTYKSRIRSNNSSIEDYRTLVAPSYFLKFNQCTD